MARELPPAYEPETDTTNAGSRQGRSFLIRFADDFVIGGELEADARQIMAGLPKRFARYGLTIPP